MVTLSKLMVLKEIDKLTISLLARKNINLHKCATSENNINIFEEIEISNFNLYFDQLMREKESLVHK